MMLVESLHLREATYHTVFHLGKYIVYHALASANVIFPCETPLQAGGGPRDAPGPTERIRGRCNRSCAYMVGNPIKDVCQNPVA
jgi:hypothetical protein